MIKRLYIDNEYRPMQLNPVGTCMVSVFDYKEGQYHTIISADLNRELNNERQHNNVTSCKF